MIKCVSVRVLVETFDKYLQKTQSMLKSHAWFFFTPYRVSTLPLNQVYF